MRNLHLLASLFILLGCSNTSVKLAPANAPAQEPVSSSICSDATECENKGLECASGGEESGYRRARLYFLRACELGDSEGCNNIAFLNANARGGPQSYTLAYKYWAKACEMGNQRGCSNLELAKDKVAQLHKYKGMTR